MFQFKIKNCVLQASDREIIWVLRLSIVLVGAVGAVIAITVHSVYGLFLLCSDLMYVIQFPQLVVVLWVPFSNTYGSLCGFIVGKLYRRKQTKDKLITEYWFRDRSYPYFLNRILIHNSFRTPWSLCICEVNNCMCSSFDRTFNW